MANVHPMTTEIAMQVWRGAAYIFKNKDRRHRIVLGKAHPKVHKALDAPIKLLGKKHRVLFHTLPEAFAIGALTESSIEGGVAGILHAITTSDAEEDCQTAANGTNRLPFHGDGSSGDALNEGSQAV
jgi:hypothetical protein